MTDPAWTDPRYEEVIRRLGARTGLSFRPQSRGGVEVGVRRAMARCGVSDLGAFATLLESDVAALDQLIVELTVGETYFFREPAQLEFISRHVVPDIRRRRGEEHTVRIWSAGCATGEEPFSLAILFDQAGLAEHVHILATDISRQALTKARDARYRDWSFRGDGARLAKPYGRRVGEVYQLDEQIRRRVTFEYLNLALDTYPSFVTGTWKLDLILCRNVLIYFDLETIRSVGARIYESLADGGWLITGSSDPALDEYAPYERVATDFGVFYRRGIAGDLSIVVPNVPRLEAITAAQVRPAEDLPGAQVADVSAEKKIAAATASKNPPQADRYGETASEDPPQADRYGDGLPGQPAEDLLAKARSALTEGDYERALALTQDHAPDPAACAIHVQAWANLDVSEAERKCAEAAARHPLSAHLNYLHSVLLLEQNRDEEAAAKARRVLYLDRSLAIAHLTLGSILRRLGDVAGARRAFRNARDLCVARPPDEPVPLSDGETAGRLVWAAEAHLHSLAALHETKR